MVSLPFFFFFFKAFISFYLTFSFSFFFLNIFLSDSHKQMNEEEGPQIATVEAFTLAEQRIKDFNTKLTEAIKEKKSTKVTLEGVERQAQTQHQQLRQTEDQLTTTKEQIGALKKKLEEAEEATAKAKQKGYEVKVAKTEENLKAQVIGVCRGCCLQVWNEALNQAGMDASSTLRRAENVFYPPALRVAGPSSSQAEAIPVALEPNQVASATALLTSTIPPQEAD